MDVQPAVEGVSWAAPGAESTPIPAGLSEGEIWQWANRQAARERRAGGHDWRWWDRRRRELAGWPVERRRQWANRSALVDVLASGARPVMPAWRARRRELLCGGGGEP